MACPAPVWGCAHGHVTSPRRLELGTRCGCSSVGQMGSQRQVELVRVIWVGGNSFGVHGPLNPTGECEHRCSPCVLPFSTDLTFCSLFARRWLEMLIVYPRTNKQNQKKKRKVEPPTPQVTPVPPRGVEIRCHPVPCLPLRATALLCSRGRSPQTLLYPQAGDKSGQQDSMN